MPESLRDFIDLMWEIMEYRPSIDWVLFAVTAWSLWNNRSNETHGGHCKGQEVLIKSVVEYVEEIKQEQHPQTSVPPQTYIHGRPQNSDGIKSKLMVQFLERLGVVELA